MPIDSKKANISGYNPDAVSTYDTEMGRHRQHISTERYRIAKLFKSINFQTPLQITVLEIGAGTGFASKAMAGMFSVKKYFVADISFEMLKEYKKIFPDNFIVQCDAEKCPFKNDRFDIVVCSSFLHHLPDDKPILSEAYRLLRTTGLFLGIREPLYKHCDFWFRFHHIPRRYGDRKGLILLCKKIASGRKGWNTVFSYDMPEDEFNRLDHMEIRGAVLHPTPTKAHGGIDAVEFKNNALHLFANVVIIPFGFSSSFFDFFSILLQKKLPSWFSIWCIRTDMLFAKISKKLPFDSFSVICKKG